MVNISKRMHKLMPRLWRLTYGPGAVVLPSSPGKPQLTGIILRVTSMDTSTNLDSAGREVLRKYLRAFKYHNLTVPITVEHKKNAEKSSFAPTLTLKFEATTRAALEAQSAQPHPSDQKAIVLLRRRVNIKTAESDAVPSEAKQKRIKALDGVTVPEGCGTLIGPVIEKSQDTTNLSQGVTRSLPGAAYERTIQLGLRGRRAPDVWRWFLKLTEAKEVPIPEADRKKIGEHGMYVHQAKKDRELAREGMEKLREEKDQLRKVKEAAQKLVAEA